MVRRPIPVFTIPTCSVWTVLFLSSVQAQVAGPVITSFTPAEGGPGTEVAIFGSGFGADPNDLWVGVTTPGLTIPFDVLRLEDVDGDGTEELIAGVPPLPIWRLAGVCRLALIAYEPGPIIVLNGQGEMLDPDRLRPDEFNAVLRQPVRVWTAGRGAAPAVAPEAFELIPAEPVDDEACFLSDPPLERKASVAVDWFIDPLPPNIEEFVFDIRLKLRDSELGTGVALHVPAVSVDGPDGSPPDLICDTITRALSVAGTDVECRHDRDTFRIEVSDPTGRGWDVATLEICYSPRMPPMPMITDINPKAGDMFTHIVIDGCGFPSDPKDVCAAIRLPDSNQPIPLQMVGADPTRLVAIPPWCPWWDGVFRGRIVVTVGRGVEGDVKPAPGWVPEGPVRAWVGDLNNSQAVSAVDYTLTMGEMPGVTIATSDPPSEGHLDLGIPPPCATRDCRVVLGAILFDEVADVGYCLGAAGTQRGESLGEALCQVITRGFAQLLGVEVTCEIGEDAAGRARLRVGLPGGQITRGVLVLGVEDAVRLRQFTRGDSNGDGELGPLPDVIFLLSYLFLRGQRPPCLAACDFNADVEVDVSDVIYLLVHFFRGGPPPPPPYPRCGRPTEEDLVLGCDESPVCVE